MRCLSVVVLLTLWPALAAQDQPAPDPVIRLTVRPAAAPVPALKYQLLPDAGDLKPGNAATNYFRAYAPEYTLHHEPVFRQAMIDWLNARAVRQQPKVPDLLRKVKGYGPLLEVDQGARRAHCDWELSDRIRAEGYGLRLPDIQPLRGWANLLSVRCHAELEDGDFAKAVYTCQTGMAMGRHVADAPTIGNLLISLGICSAMLDNAQDIITAPGSPNLYWALTALPRPLIDLRRPLQGERQMVESSLGDLSRLENTALTPEHADDLRQRLGRVLNSIDGRKTFGEYEREYVTAFVLMSYPAAKEWLLAQGKPADLVERMPTFQVVLLYSLMECRRVSDELVKRHSLPYWEADDRLSDMRRELGMIRMRGAIPLATVLLVAHLQAYEARMRLERRIDVLRVIEALRLHAAAHGEWPATLADIKGVVIPLDLYRGKPFFYRREGNKATLIAQSRSNPPQNYDQLQYELTLEK